MKRWKISAVALLLTAGLATLSVADSGPNGTFAGSGKAYSWWFFGTGIKGDVTLADENITV